MRLIWLRHGETDGNVRRLYIGHRDLPLNASGQKQTEQLAKRLSREPITAIYTSDLIRAKQSAQKLLAYFPHARYQVTPLLRECDFGEWDGLTYDEICARDREGFERWFQDPFHHPPAKGETMTKMDRRLHQLVERIERDHQEDELIAIVTHGGPMRWAWAKLIKRDWQAMWNVRIPTGGGWMIEKKKSGWQLLQTIESGE